MLANNFAVPFIVRDISLEVLNGTILYFFFKILGPGPLVLPLLWPRRRGGLPRPGPGLRRHRPPVFPRRRRRRHPPPPLPPGRMLLRPEPMLQEEKVTLRRCFCDILSHIRIIRDCFSNLNITS